MKNLILIGAIMQLISLSAFAGLYEDLNKNYDPNIQSRVEETSYSLCEVNEVTIQGKDPITQQVRNVEVLEYKPYYDQAESSILLLPPTGGMNFLDQNYALNFCLQLSTRVVILKGWDNDQVSMDVRDHDIQGHRALAAMRHTLDFIGEDQVPVFGTSAGAISGSLLLGMDDRVSGGVFIVGGVGMKEIIAQSTEEGLTQLRRERMKKHGFKTKAEYQHYISENVHIEPADLAYRYENKPVHIVIASDDRTVPTKNQQDFVDSFVDPVVTEIDGNHMEAILGSHLFYKNSFTNFLSEIL